MLSVIKSTRRTKRLNKKFDVKRRNAKSQLELIPFDVTMKLYQTSNGLKFKPSYRLLKRILTAEISLQNRRQVIFVY